MNAGNNTHPVQDLAAALTGLKFYFVISPDDGIFFIEPNGRTINIEEIPALLHSFMLGEFALPIQQILKAHPEPDFPSLMSKPKGPSAISSDERVWRHVLKVYDLATKTAEELAQKYNVHVAILETKAEFLSEETAVKSITDNVFFISKDDPRGTGQLTDYLLKHLSLKSKYQLKEANAKRFIRADETASQLKERIDELKQQYRESHENQEPSLGKIAELLTAQEIEAPGGGSKWFAQTVKRVLERAEIKR